MKKEKVFIAGASGFLGKLLSEQLGGVRRSDFSSGRSGFDLTKTEDCMRATKGCDVVINAAGLVTSRRDQELRPAQILYVNTLLNLQLLEACRRNKVFKVIMVGSITAYPDDIKPPFREEQLFTGHAPRIRGLLGYYGLSKWLVPQAALAYQREYGLRVRVVVFPNLYGPADKFDHRYPPLVPNLIGKMHEAVRSGAAVFSAGGSPRAELDLLHVEDAVSFIIRVLRTFGSDGYLTVNAGSSRPVTIEKVTALIARSLGFKGKIHWEDRRGGERRLLDSALARKRYGWRPTISIEDGIRRTVRWFLNDYAFTA